MEDIKYKKNDLEINENYKFMNNTSKILLNDIEEDKLCLICFEKNGILVLCNKCKYKYCQDCAIKLNNNCSICFRIYKKKIYFDLSDYSFIYHHNDTEPLQLSLQFNIIYILKNIFLGLLWIIIIFFFGYVGILFVINIMFTLINIIFSKI